jgi:hypothetical protein
LAAASDAVYQVSHVCHLIESVDAESLTLYYRKQGDIWRWTPTSGSVKFKARVSWIDPSVSLDGKYIVYMERASQGTPTVHLMDAATRRCCRSSARAPADVPFFLTNDLI